MLLCMRSREPVDTFHLGGNRARQRVMAFNLSRLCLCSLDGVGEWHVKLPWADNKRWCPLAGTRAQ